VVVDDWAAFRAFLTAEAIPVARATKRLIPTSAGNTLRSLGRQDGDIVELELMSVPLRVRKPTRSPILIPNMAVVEQSIDGASHPPAEGRSSRWPGRERPDVSSSSP
jgi:hypothetical protein